MTTYTAGTTIAGFKASVGGNFVIGCDTSGVPVLGLTVTSATSVQSAGNNAYLTVRDGAGTVFYLIARTSAP